MSAATEPRPLPEPLVKLTQHPLRWLKNKAELAIAGVALGHIGTLIVVGLYFLAFQTNPSVKHFWDHLLSTHVPLFSQGNWNTYRHLVRGVGEGVLAGGLVQLITLNHFKRRRAPNAFDRLEMRLNIPNIKDAKQVTGWQLILTPLLILTYAIPGFVVGALVVYAFRHGLAGHTYKDLVGRSNLGRSAWSHIQNVWTSARDQKVVGFFASFFLARRPVRAVADDVQGYFVARRVASGKSQRFYHPPNFRARMNAATVEGANLRLGAAARLMPVFLTLGIVLGLALAGFGYWVLANKAH
jgi:hypothetical protein